MSDDIQKQMEAWLKQQQAYWSQLAAGEEAGDAPSTWQRLLSEYQASAFRDVPEQNARLAALLASNAGLFNRFGEQILTALKTSAASPALEETVEQLVAYLQQHTTSAMLQQWQLPQHFAALFKSHSFADDPLFENPFVSGLKSLLDTPAFGSNRQLQQQARDALKLLLDYQEALHRYTAQYGSINQLAGKRLLQALRDSDNDLDSVGELHALWVDCYEAAYAEAAFTSEYQTAHGQVSNALMKLRKFLQDVRDFYFEAVGLATREGLNTALERQHQLRKQVKQLQRELQQTRAQLGASVPLSEFEALRAEFDALRAEVRQAAVESGAGKSRQ
ncbi:hypothetical protein GCM10011348_01900 [Marinobacterium nitratireducens]|uniref:Poly(3-hydroxyalkanoate) polymerase subunit PhaE n=1 Tax=Marinobacterium nitratireducens TaxID=518897 RepID=A0A918DNT4_9GAMM|nr:poly(R)-hydroxyalkanoic acid synthase subunit PhaE [Marinobacterium nitratireducens]GGO75924.1 hypothetical protein GCM10011348_01900 [Marinobacterium nitratireducens]